MTPEAKARAEAAAVRLLGMIDISIDDDPLAARAGQLAGAMHALLNGWAASMAADGLTIEADAMLGALADATGWLVSVSPEAGWHEMITLAAVGIREAAEDYVEQQAAGWPDRVMQ